MLVEQKLHLQIIRVPSNRCSFNLQQVGHHPGYTVFATLGSFYIPLALLLVVYTRIYFAIHRQIKRSESRSRIVSWSSDERKSLSVRSRSSPPRDVSQRPISQKETNGVVHSDQNETKNGRRMGSFKQPSTCNPGKEQENVQSPDSRRGISVTNETKFSTITKTPNNEGRFLLQTVFIEDNWYFLPAYSVPFLNRR